MKPTMKLTAGLMTAALAGCSSPRVSAPPAPETLAKAEPVRQEDGLLLLVLPAPAAPPRQETGALRLASGAPAASLAPEDTQIKEQIFGPVAQVTVSQIFRNTTGQTVDAAWMLPVPVSAVVMDLTVDIGGRHFRAVTVDEAQAETLYAAAVAQGRHAAVVKAEDAGWRLRLGQVKAGEKVATGVVYGQVKFEAIPAGDGELSVVRNGERVKLSWTHGTGPSKVVGSKEIRNAQGQAVGWETTLAGSATTGYQFELLGAPSVTDDHAEAFPVYAALWASGQIQALAFADRAAAKPAHTQEILAIARKHKIVCPGMSLLMVDAKK